MSTPLDRLTRRNFLRSTAFVGAGAATTAIGLTPAYAAPIAQLFLPRRVADVGDLCRYLIDEWNKKNGGRIHATGASVTARRIRPSKR